jgi:hypothetical protein
MPNDAQIVSSADHAAPKDYTVPGNAELILKAVQASFTDNGAASDWLPCVTLISDSGHIIARACDQNVKVTAGDDADVSWFPNVSRSAGAGGGGTTAIVAYTLSITWPNSGPPINNGAWTLANSYDTSVFNFSNSFGAAIEILAPGKYIVWVTVEWDLTNWGTNVWVGLGGDADNFTQVSANGSNAVGQGPYYLGNPLTLWYANIAVVPTGTTFPLQVKLDGFQQSGADRPQNAQLMAWRIDATPIP